MKGLLYKILFKLRIWMLRLLNGCPDEMLNDAMLMENTMPEMQDLPLRKGKKTFEYFETEVET